MECNAFRQPHSHISSLCAYCQPLPTISNPFPNLVWTWTNDCAHKPLNLIKSHFYPRCGEWDTQTESEPLNHQDRNVTVIIMHPEFSAKNVYNNIALVLVETPFELANHVDTICLPKYQENFDDRQKCFVKVQQCICIWYWKGFFIPVPTFP